MKITIKDQIMNVLTEKYGQGTFQRKDVIQAVLDVTKPGETYTHERWRGQYSAALRPRNGYLLYPSTRSKAYLAVQSRGVYKVQQ